MAPKRPPRHRPIEKKGLGESLLGYIYRPPPPPHVESPIAFGELVHNRDAQGQDAAWKRAPHIEVMEKAILRALDKDINPQGGRLIITVSVRAGKALEVTTPVSTSDGWKSIGEIVEGDVVYDEQGRECNVTHAFDSYWSSEAYIVAFDGRETIVADAPHQWMGFSRSDVAGADLGDGWWRQASTLTTAQIAERLPGEGFYIPMGGEAVPVDAITPVGTRRVRCISVDSPSHLYLAGEAMVPTHNSMFGSRIVPAWFLGTHPDERVMLIGHEADFASRHGRAARDMLTEHGHLFGVDVSSDSQAANRWDLAGRQGGMLTLGIGGSPIGRGANLCVAAGTLVSTPIGEVEIDALAHRGGTVWAHDGERAVECRITAAIESESDDLVEVIFESGRRLRCTPDHPILSDGAWVEAGDLTPGASVTTLAESGVPTVQQPLRQGGPISAGFRTAGEADVLLETVRRPQPGSTPPGESETPRSGDGSVRPLPEADRDAGVELRQTEPSRSDELLLRQPLRGSRTKDTAPMRGVWRFHRQEAAAVLPDLRCRATQSPTHAGGEGLSDLRRDVPTQVSPGGELLEAVCSEGSLEADERGGQRPLQGRDRTLRRVVPQDAPLYQGARRRLRRVWNHGGADAGAPHRRGQDAQQPDEPGVAVHQPSHEAPPVGRDVVSLVRRVRGEGHIVYDLTVEGCHNFSAGGVVAHNCIVDDPYRNFADAMNPRVRNEVIEFVAGTMFSRVQNQGTIIIIMARWHCLLPGSLVQVDSGDLVPIESLDDEPLATSDGWSAPLAAANRQVSEQAVAIHVTGLPDPLRVTTDHRVLTTFGWVEAGDVVAGDHVVMNATPADPWRALTYTPPSRVDRPPTGARLPAGTPAWHIAMLRDFGYIDAEIGARFGRSRQWVQNLRHELWGTAEERNLPDEAFDDPEVWWAIGRWLADGSLSAPRGDVKSVAVWSIGWNKWHDADRIRNAFERHGLSVSIRPNRNLGGGFPSDRTVSSWTVRLSSKRFATTVSEFGLGAWNKRVPAGVESLPEPLVRAFIRGAYDGDGCVWNEHWNRYSTRSLALAMGLRRCLAAVGVAPTVMRSGKAFEVRYHDDEWAGRHLSRKRVFNVGGDLHHRVQRVERFHYEGPVYDLTTKAGDFIADGVTVHNCEDLAGHLLAQTDQEWDHVNMPALCVDPISDPLGRAEGESIWPEMLPRHMLLQRRKEVSIKDGEAVWDAQYQQDPRASEGDMFDADKWQEWEGIARPPQAKRWVRAWDLAATKGGGDWTVGVLMCELPDDMGWLISDVVRGRWDSRVVRQKMDECARTDPPNTTIRFPQDPGQAGKDQAAQMARRLQGHRVRYKVVTGPKEIRAQGFSSQQLAGNIWLPAGVQHAVWRGALIAETNAFPYGSHDDLCLVGGAEVITPKGRVRLDSVRSGGVVLGASGWVGVEWAGMTSASADVVEVGGVVATPKHPVWVVGEGWGRVSDLTADAILWTCAPLKDATVPARPEDCASTTSTTSTATTPTTIPATWKPYPPASTWPLITPQGPRLRTPSVLTSTGSATWPPSGIALRRVGHGIASTLVRRGSAPVFNLRTTDGTFFASGVLVHNCDAAADAFNVLAGNRARLLV